MSDTSVTFTFKSRAEQRVEAEHGAPIEVLLRTMYDDEGLTQEQVAERLGVRRPAVVRWMSKYRIPTRDRRAVPA